MKIAVNTRFLLSNKLEGIGKFTAETLRRITQNHPEHEFIFFFDRPYSKQFIFADNVTPVVLFPQARHPVLFYLWFEWSIAAALKKYKADIFLSTDGFLSLHTAVPTLLVVHDLAFCHFPDYVKKIEQRYYEYFMPRFVKKAAKIATVSTFSKNDIIQQYGIDSEKINVVYNGADHHFQPIPITEQASIRKQYANGQPYFLYLGSVHPRKNVARLIAAFDRFKTQITSPIKLLIAGRKAWQTGEVEAAYQSASAKNDIQFLDYVPDADLPKLIASAYALTYVSLFEGFGIPILEAMYCDVPSITSNTSSMPEVAGNAGILVNPYDIDNIAQAMAKMWSDKSFRKDLISKGRFQRQQFTWDKTATKLYNMIAAISHSTNK